jgi:hypothetical protein
MRATLILFFLFSLSFVAMSQTHEEVIINRAKAYYKVLTVNDKEQWRKFMTDNYTKALLERPMKARIAEEGVSKPAAENEKVDPIESKLVMFQRLNADFGGSTITSIKATGDEVVMILSSSEISGTFTLMFDKTAPYLIDRIGVEVGMDR